MKMLGIQSIFGKKTEALAAIALILASAAVASQGFLLIPAASAATCENLKVTGVSAIGYEGSNRPANVIDNRLTTRWSHFGAGSWITADLGAQKTVCSVDIAWYKGFGRTNDFAISVSADGKSFSTVYSGESTGKTLSAERYSFAETTARYVRVTFDGSSDGEWASITEIDVYGYSASVADAAAPSVSITSPADGSALVQQTGRVSVAGTASDNAKVQKVEVKVDDGAYALATPRAAGDWSQWTIAVDLASGSHRILSRATDGSGNQAWSDVNIDLTINSADTTLPSVQITNPAANSDVVMSDGKITVTGTASDGQSGVDSVDVRVDSGAYVAATPKAAGDWSQWSVTLPVTAGERRLVPRATDNAGNQAWNSIYVTVTTGSTSPPPPTGGDSALDAFGIEKIYPTKQGGNEWYVNMNDPKSDPLFKNLPSMTKQADGSWQVSASQVRMEAWSPSNEKWLNVEITEYAKIVGGSNYLLQMYSRGGHHTSSNECLGSAYKARLYGDGEARWVKEVTHPAYTSNRGSVQATTDSLEGRWVGFKAVIYNFVENGKTYVRMESYIDDDVTDAKGNLVIGNNWKLASVVEDRGGWGSGDSDFRSDCAPVNKDSTSQYRQKDEILNTGGGTGTQNLAAWRSDGLTWNWKYLTVREIVPPS